MAMYMSERLPSDNILTHARGFFPGHVFILVLGLLLCLAPAKAPGQHGLDVIIPTDYGYPFVGASVVIDSNIVYFCQEYDEVDYLDTNLLYLHSNIITLNKYTGEWDKVRSLDTSYFWQYLWTDIIPWQDSMLLVPLGAEKPPYPMYMASVNLNAKTVQPLFQMDLTKTFGNPVSVARFIKSRFHGYYITGRLDQAKGTTVWKLDDALNLQWTKYYHLLYNSFDPYEADNGDLLIGGYKFKEKSDCWNSQGTCWSTMNMIRIDSTGKQISYKENADGTPRRVYGWIPVTDSTYLFMSGKGRVDTLLTTKWVEVHYQRGATLMDQDLNEISYAPILSDTFYPSDNDYYFFNYRPVKNGSGVIAAGETYEYVEHPVWGPYYENNTHVIKLSNTGDSLWHRKYIHPSTTDTIWRSSYPRHLATNVDGTITIGGLSGFTTVPEFEGGQHIWILYLDSFGCVVPGCQNTTAIEEFPPRSLDVRVYPNPVQQGPLAVYIGEEGPLGDLTLTLLDLQGKEVLRHQSRHNGAATYLLDLPGLHSGMYILQVSSSHRSWSGKVIIVE